MTNQTETPAGPTAQKQALLEAFDTVLKQQAEAREAELREAEARRRARRRVRPWPASASAWRTSRSTWCAIASGPAPCLAL